jgi:hypothetical protein
MNDNNPVDEFGSATNALTIRDKLRDIGCYLVSSGYEANNHSIVCVATGPAGHSTGLRVTERDARLIQFAIDRALTTI